MHTCNFNSEIRRLSQLSVRRPEKLFKTNPYLLYFRNAIPLANFQPRLARLVEYYVSDIDCLELGKRCNRYVGEIKKLVDCEEHGRDRVARVVHCTHDPQLHSSSSLSPSETTIIERLSVDLQ